MYNLPAFAGVSWTGQGVKKSSCGRGMETHAWWWIVEARIVMVLVGRIGKNHLSG